MNAKLEFLSIYNYESISIVIIGAIIELHSKISILNPGYTEKEYDDFLESIDIEYDSGFGGQELVGTIYCENGIWADRSEYDGCEWWETHEYPSLRESFDEKIVVQYERKIKLERIKKIKNYEN